MKQSHDQSCQALRVQEIEDPRFQDNRRMKVVRFIKKVSVQLYK